jgi:hypothetical protein
VPSANSSSRRQPLDFANTSGSGPLLSVSPADRFRQPDIQMNKHLRRLRGVEVGTRLSSIAVKALTVTCTAEHSDHKRATNTGPYLAWARRPCHLVAQGVYPRRPREATAERSRPKQDKGATCRQPVHPSFNCPDMSISRNTRVPEASIARPSMPIEHGYVAHMANSTVDGRW